METPNFEGLLIMACFLAGMVSGGTIFVIVSKLTETRYSCAER